MMSVGRIAASFGEPLVLGGIIVFIWWHSLGEVVRRPRAALPAAAAGLALVAASAVVLAVVGRADAAPQEFPGERIRTAVPAPGFELVDQEGQTLAASSLRGRVVLMTGVYASCGNTCPMILAQARRVVGALTAKERAEVTVVAVTLDPTRDDRRALAALAAAQQVSAPAWRLVGGEPARVEATLDAMGITRKRNPETGLIDHANLFLVVDRAGRVAYRFTLGELQERWTVEALRSLVAERP
jgi:protein SCO1/2